MTNTSDNLRDILPSYQQMKIINGAKILDIVEAVDGYLLTLDTNELRGLITPRDNPTKHDLEWAAGYKPGGKHYNEACHKTKVDFTWHSKHSPVVGGYFVLYPDGYTSYSPAEPFEAGNVLRDVNWRQATDDQVNHAFFQLRHNLNTIRWGHVHLDKAMETLSKKEPEHAHIQQVWIAGRGLVPLLTQRGISTDRVPRRSGNPLLVDLEGRYIPEDILIRAEFDGQMLVYHTASWVVLE